MLRGKKDADWPELIESWKREQDQLRARIVICPLKPPPRFITGADAAFSSDKQTVFAAAVVYDRHERRIIEVAHATRPAEFPYIPGYLSFREGPAVMDAIRKLRHEFGAICFDAQGMAHPRRCGLAAHVAVQLDLPGVGCAKSRLIGTHDTPGRTAGSHRPLMDGDEQIGIALRTRDDVNPLYVSVGHRMDLPSARQLVLACCTRYRIPEPTRQADIEVGKLKSQHS